MDLAARWHSESSRTREWTHVPIWQADSYPLDHQGSPNFILLHVDYPATAAPFVKKIILSPLNGLGTLVKNQLTMWVNFWTQFYSIDLNIYPYTNTTLSWLVLLCIKFWNWEGESPSTLFFKILMAIQASYNSIWTLRLICWFWGAETPILWPPDVKNQLTGKDPDAGKDWRQEEKGTTEDEMVGWHHWWGWWTWVWVSSRSWWWTGKPGMLQSMGLQIVWHNWGTELNCWFWQRS